VELRAGTPVAVSGPLPPAGTIRVTTTGRVVVSGTVDVAALGLYVQTDGDLRAGDGIVLGTIFAGARVHLLGKTSVAGWVRVRTGGPASMIGAVRADMLGVSPHEFIYRPPSGPRMVWALRDVALYEHAASVGTSTPPLGTLAAAGDAVLVDQVDTLAHVRTYGPVEVEGWALGRDFTEEQPGPPAELLKPTHEVLVGAELRATATARQTLAHLRGGALVEVNGHAGELAKVTTVGDVILVGFVPERALRPLVAGESPIP
jgi:hypothetical protein